jgi:2-dehydro-3-deoxy-L-rhamnonate dehydrogenase (NAD+)
MQSATADAPPGGRQTVLVAGAGSGIGRAITVHLAAAGWGVALLDVDPAGLAETQAQLADADPRLAFAGDVADEPFVEQAIRATVERTGQLHGLVNCAAIAGPQNLLSGEVESAGFEAVMRVNLIGAFHLSKHAIRAMLPHRYGRIVHLASIAGKEGNPGLMAYSTSKAAVIGMVKCQGKEYAETGITINAIAPGVIMTPMVEAQDAAQTERLVSRIPMGRPGTLAEISNLVGYVLSPGCSFTTGFTYDLSGGRAVY